MEVSYTQRKEFIVTEIEELLLEAELEADLEVSLKRLAELSQLDQELDFYDLEDKELFPENHDTVSLCGERYEDGDNP